MTEPAIYPEGTPTVTLAGKVWPVPELAVRQLRHVRRPLIDLTEAITQQTEKTTDEATGEVIEKVIKSSGALIMALSEAQYEQMTDVVFWGLSRAHPDLKKEEFLDWPASELEMLNAFFAVRSQSGVFMKAAAAAAPKEGEPGEAKAETGAP